MSQVFEMTRDQQVTRMGDILLEEAVKVWEAPLPRLTIHHTPGEAREWHVEAEFNQDPGHVPLKHRISAPIPLPRQDAVFRTFARKACELLRDWYEEQVPHPQIDEGGHRLGFPG